jgi:hypothetical protein
MSDQSMSPKCQVNHSKDISHLQIEAIRDNNIECHSGCGGISRAGKKLLGGSRMSTRLARIWQSLSLLVALVATGYAAEVPICSIIANPKSFDHQNVSLQGTIGSLRETTSRRGNDYTTFKVQRRPQCLHVGSPCIDERGPRARGWSIRDRTSSGLVHVL